MPYKKIVITPTKYSVQQTNKTSQIYKGYSTLVSSDDVKVYDFELIKQDLINHFKTRKGERVMNPDFGTAIWDLIFDPFTDDTKDLIKEDVSRILNSDPRIVPIQIKIYDEPYGMMLETTLSYVGTDQTENLKLTFDKNSGLDIANF